MVFEDLIPGTAAAVTANSSSLPVAYIICIIIISIEVAIITAMIVYLLWKPKGGKYFYNCGIRPRNVDSEYYITGSFIN